MHDARLGRNVLSMVAFIIYCCSYYLGARLMKATAPPSPSGQDLNGIGKEVLSQPGELPSSPPRKAGPAQRAGTAGGRSDLDIATCTALPSPLSTIRAPSARPQTFFPIDGSSFPPRKLQSVHL